MLEQLVDFDTEDDHGHAAHADSTQAPQQEFLTKELERVLNTWKEHVKLPAASVDKESFNALSAEQQAQMGQRATPIVREPPLRTNRPINENRKGLIINMFPDIFAGNLVADNVEFQGRKLRQIRSFKEWSQIVLLATQGRAMRNHIFRWWSFDKEARRRAADCRKAFMRTKYGRMDMEELAELTSTEEGKRRVVKTMLTACSSADAGSLQQKRFERYDLDATVKQLVEEKLHAGLFTTFSSSLYRWDGLSRWIRRYDDKDEDIPGETEEERLRRYREQAVRNPYIAAYYAFLRLELAYHAFRNELAEIHNLGQEWLDNGDYHITIEWGSISGLVHLHTLTWFPRDCHDIGYAYEGNKINVDDRDNVLSTAKYAAPGFKGIPTLDGDADNAPDGEVDAEVSWDYDCVDKCARWASAVYSENHPLKPTKMLLESGTA